MELKHTLETVPPLAEALKGCQNSLLQAILNNLQDPRIEALQMKLEDVVREDAIYVKNTHKMRNQVMFRLQNCIRFLLTNSCLTVGLCDQGTLVFAPVGSLL